MDSPHPEYLRLVPERPSDIPLPDFKKFPSWRKYQREALALTLQRIDEGFGHIAVIAPTGFGKSLFAMALVYQLIKPIEREEDELMSNGKAYVVTETKQLQDQYMRDFSELIRTIKGRSNYPCPFLSIDGIEMTANECIERAGDRCPIKDTCPYFIARDTARRWPVTIFNYAYFLNSLNYTRLWSDAKVTIFDEAHLAEGKLADFIEFRITKRQLDRLEIPFPVITTISDALMWLEELSIELSLRIEDLKEAMAETRDREKIKALTKQLDELERFQRKANFLLSNLDESWLIRATQNQVLSFRPIWVKQFGRMLWGHAETNVYMSATLSQKNVELLGVDEDEIATIEVPAIFPPDRRPITIVPGAPHISKKNEEKTLPLAMTLIDRILDYHFSLGHKGVIHTANTRYARFVVEHSKHRDKLMLAFGRDRGRVIEEFTEAEGPLALVGPNLETGIDLRGDLGRFQIILKVPYPNLGDEIVAIRKQEDNDWFQMITSHRLVQAYGRTNRAEDDFSITYVIDANAKRLLNSRHVPLWFREAMVELREAINMLNSFLREVGVIKDD